MIGVGEPSPPKWFPLSHALELASDRPTSGIGLRRGLATGSWWDRWRHCNVVAMSPRSLGVPPSGVMRQSPAVTPPIWRCHGVRWWSLPNRGRVEPVLKPDHPKLRPVARDERVLGRDRAEVRRPRIGDHLTRIVARAQATPDDAVEAEPLGAGDLQATIQRGVHCDPGDRARDVVGRERSAAGRRAS